MCRVCLVCRKLDYKFPKLTFHRVPRNLERRSIWFCLLGFDENKQVSKNAHICSEHFKVTDFHYKDNGLKYLYKDALPLPHGSNIIHFKNLSSDSSVTVTLPQKRLNEISKQEDLEIKVEESVEIKEIEKQEDIVDQKFQIKNEELKIKDKINIVDEGQRNSDMEVPQVIKQEKVEYDATEPDVDFDKNISDSMEMKLEFVKLESPLLVPEPNNLDQKFTLTEDFNFSLNEMSKQQDSGIKLEESGATDGFEKMDESNDVKWTIKDEEVNIKEEENVEDEQDSRASMLVSRQQQRKTREASGSKKKISGYNFRCEQCEYRTSQKRYLKDHLKRHEKSKTFKSYKLIRHKNLDHLLSFFNSNPYVLLKSPRYKICVQKNL